MGVSPVWRWVGAGVWGGCDCWWGVALGVSGIPRVTPHELRHTAASLAVQSGADVKAVQRVLGYVSAAMTLDVCADLFGDDLDVLAQRLDSVAWLHSM